MKNADYAICTTVLKLNEWMSSETICLYFSRPDEVDTTPLLARGLTDNKRMVFPRMENEILILHEIHSIKDFVKGRYQILEPKKTTGIISPRSVDLFIVPGRIFDENCNRIGRGKGYYDRLLSGVSVPKIGLAYEFQIVAWLPHSSYDVPMTKVISEEKIYAP